jgi:hypothetical protein
MNFKIIKKINKNEKKFEEIVKEKLTFKLKKDLVFSKNFYRCLCNTTWFNENINDIFSCTWRYAAHFIANTMMPINSI